MRIENLSVVKNNLSKFVEQVRQGMRIRIAVHGVPVADLVGVGESILRDGQYDGTKSGEESANIRSLNLPLLEREGLIRIGSGMIPSDIFEKGPRLTGTPLSDIISEERRLGR